MRIENFPKLKRCDHSPKRYEFIDVSLDPPYFSLDSPFKRCIRDHPKDHIKDNNLVFIMIPPCYKCSLITCTVFIYNFFKICKDMRLKIHECKNV